MAIYPGATVRLLPENETQARITPVMCIWHSAVDAPGPTSLYGYFARDDIGVESHFFIRFSGEVEQYIDTERRADANNKANRFRLNGAGYGGAVSVETEDDGDPNNTPLSPEQVDSAIKLGKWLEQTHGIPPEICPGPFAPGHGWHRQYIEHWSLYPNKSCPGDVRIPQIRDEIVPGIAGIGGGFLEALTPAEQQEVLQFVRRSHPHGDIKQDGTWYVPTYLRISETVKLVRKLRAMVAAQSAAIDRLAEAQGADAGAVSDAIDNAVDRAVERIDNLELDVVEGS